MSATYTPSDAIDMSKEKDWAYQLALLDWDKTSVVFTKRSLLDFLNSVGMTVDPNLVKIQKLPQYAKFGRLSDSIGDAKPVESQATASTESRPAATSSSAGGFIPTRKVRDLPGGKTSIAIGGGWGEDDTYEAPPRTAPAPTEEYGGPPARQTAQEIAKPSLKPTEHRRNVGTSLGPDMFTAENDVFVPTRRVRDRPGGDDHLTEMFSE